MCIIGVYPTVISAISNLPLDITVVTGHGGIVVGLVTMSNIIHFFLTHYHTGTFAIFIGFVIGSILVVFSGGAENTLLLLLSVVTFAIGLFMAYILGKVEYKE